MSHPWQIDRWLNCPSFSVILIRGLLLFIVGDEVIIAEGSTRILPEDIVFFLGHRKHTAAVMAQFHVEGSGCKRVMIAGGGNIGLSLARKL